MIISRRSRQFIATILVGVTNKCVTHPFFKMASTLRGTLSLPWVDNLILQRQMQQLHRMTFLVGIFGEAVQLLLRETLGNFAATSELGC